MPTNPTDLARAITTKLSNQRCAVSGRLALTERIIAQHLEPVVEWELRWTSERPTEPGWYWFRSSVRNGIEPTKFFDEVIAVLTGRNGLLHVYRETYCETVNEYCGVRDNCLWAGPLTPPGEKEMDELRAIAGDKWDKIDPGAYVRELRGGDDETTGVKS